eukprot:GHVL01022477.1.p1 GENE.GHVL01022477.1~~GHVL01022477.1.p1  ORF type:complete len:774 (+),score=132.15 GHVL01022477.1:1038-3359(+)
MCVWSSNRGTGRSTTWSYWDDWWSIFRRRWWCCCWFVSKEKTQTTNELNNSSKYFTQIICSSFIFMLTAFRQIRVFSTIVKDKVLNETEICDLVSELCSSNNESELQKVCHAFKNNMSSYNNIAFSRVISLLAHSKIDINYDFWQSVHDVALKNIKEKDLPDLDIATLVNSISYINNIPESFYHDIIDIFDRAVMFNPQAMSLLFLAIIRAKCVSPEYLQKLVKKFRNFIYEDDVIKELNIVDVAMILNSLTHQKISEDNIDIIERLSNIVVNNINDDAPIQSIVLICHAYTKFKYNNKKVLEAITAHGIKNASEYTPMGIFNILNMASKLNPPGRSSLRIAMIKPIIKQIREFQHHQLVISVFSLVKLNVFDIILMNSYKDIVLSGGKDKFDSSQFPLIFYAFSKLQEHLNRAKLNTSDVEFYSNGTLVDFMKDKKEVINWGTTILDKSFCQWLADCAFTNLSEMNPKDVMMTINSFAPIQHQISLEISKKIQNEIKEISFKDCALSRIELTGFIHGLSRLGWKIDKLMLPLIDRFTKDFNVYDISNVSITPNSLFKLDYIHCEPSEGGLLKLLPVYEMAIKKMGNYTYTIGVDQKMDIPRWYPPFALSTCAIMSYPAFFIIPNKLHNLKYYWINERIPIIIKLLKTYSQIKTYNTKYHNNQYHVTWTILWKLILIPFLKNKNNLFVKKNETFDLLRGLYKCTNSTTKEFVTPTETESHLSVLPVIRHCTTRWDNYYLSKISSFDLQDWQMQSEVIIGPFSVDIVIRPGHNK